MDGRTEDRTILHDSFNFHSIPFLRAFAKLRKVTITFVMCLSVCLSVRMEQLGSHYTDFHEI